MCGGPTAPAKGGARGPGASHHSQRAEPSTSGWFRLPLLDYPVTSAVAVLGAVLLGSVFAVGIAARLRARPPAATGPN